MSRDWTFKENMIAHKFVENLPPYGIFIAKYDLHEIFVEENKPTFTINDKINLFKSLLNYHTTEYCDYNDCDCKDVAEFLYDYCNYLEILDINDNFKELKDTLIEMLYGDGTLNGFETFKFFKNYCNNLKLFDNIERKDIEKEKD